MGGDGRRFHVNADRAALAETERGFGVAQLPIAIIGGDDGAGAQPCLERFAAFARNGLRRARHGLLNLGNRRDRNFGREDIVKHMIITEVGVGEDIIADPLACAQAATVADHQPRLGAQHRKVIRDRLGVRGADADIDERDSVAIGRYQMPRWHLMPPPRAIGNGILRARRAVGDRQASGAGQHRVGRVTPQLGRCPSDEFIDIAVVVCEQHIALNMFRRGACVMPQPGKREISAQPVKQREWHWHAVCAEMNAVGDFIADMGKLSRGEPAGKVNRADVAKFGACIKNIGEGDFLPPSFCLNGDAVILDKDVDLLGQIIGEEFGLGDARRVMAGAGEPAERTLRLSIACVATPVNMDFRIGEAAVSSPCRIGQGAIGDIGFDCGAQLSDCFFEQGFKLGNDGLPRGAFSLLCHAVRDTAEL